MFASLTIAFSKKIVLKSSMRMMQCSQRYLAPALQHLFPEVSFIEIYFHFITDLGPSFGPSKLVRSAQDNKWRAFALFILLEGIHGHIGTYRPHGRNGLKLAARLKAIKTSSLLIDKEARLVDNWRLRYKSSLHDPLLANHLTYLPFPPNWPIFNPFGKLANWFETYGHVLECLVLLHPHPNRDQLRRNHAQLKRLRDRSYPAECGGYGTSTLDYHYYRSRFPGRTYDRSQTQTNCSPSCPTPSLNIRLFPPTLITNNGHAPTSKPPPHILVMSSFITSPRGLNDGKRMGSEAGRVEPAHSRANKQAWVGHGRGTPDRFSRPSRN
ncbi:hypothetical protein PILCRDRAFT_5032 [Piloderma croceum F 1598]|uniref:Uncharacterized protein n=1 Tax=Piloderma croceum (strain F 1598) TaxID=765440 RepID=A0A0C3FPD1_PILCF|nr:hypothetical protein PILCRDRAFT_5032 [Piloderma croceum F 1598]